MPKLDPSVNSRDGVGMRTARPIEQALEETVFALTYE
jgi:hypothetical protein